MENLIIFWKFQGYSLLFSEMHSIEPEPFPLALYPVCKCSDLIMCTNSIVFMFIEQISDEFGRHVVLCGTNLITTVQCAIFQQCCQVVRVLNLPYDWLTRFYLFHAVTTPCMLVFLINEICTVLYYIMYISYCK
jgi:hypothetical protein